MFRILLLTFTLLAAFAAGGCEAVEGIFEAGLWTGVILVVIILAVVGFVIAKLRR